MLKLVRSVAVFLATVPLGHGITAQGDQDVASRKPVVVLAGASVTAGFVDPRPRADGERNSTVSLRRIVRAFWPRGAVTVRDRSDIATFVDPLARQTARIARVRADEPALVIAIDYAFWFGYGRVAGRTADDELDQRLARLARGLSLLEPLTCPIVLGDLPDMRGADRRMLHPSQIPTPGVLGALNERLHAWARERGHVRVFPLSMFVARTKENAVMLVEDGGSIAFAPFFAASNPGIATGGLAAPPIPSGDRADPARTVAVPAEVLLQGDRLHATRLGMALLGQRLAEELGLVLADSRLQPAAELSALVEAAGAEVAVDELLERAASSGEPSSGK